MEFSGDESREWMMDHVLDDNLFPGLGGYFRNEVTEWGVKNPGRLIDGRSVQEWLDDLFNWDDMESEDVLILGEELGVWSI